MRTLRFLGMALIAILISVNFAACSSDDDESDSIDLNNLENDWFVTRCEGYEGDKTEGAFEYTYSQSNLENLDHEDDAERFVISASPTTEGTYSLHEYYYTSWNKEWQRDASFTINVAGNMISGFSYNRITSWKIVSLSKNKLVIEGSLTGQYERYEKFTCEPFKNN